MTTVEQVVTPEEDVTTVDETRPDQVEHEHVVVETPVVEASGPIETVDEEAAPTPAEVADSGATFTFTPLKPETNEYGDEIVYPDESFTVPSAATLVKPDKQRWFWWRISKLQESGDPLAAPVFWLEFAKVDYQLQSRILNLPIEEWERFFTGWLRKSTGATPGE